MEKNKRVGVFLRVSTDMQVQGDSPEHHEARARQFAQSREWDVIEIYRLYAVSGKSVMEHPETKRMLADIRSRHITGLVFSKLARLARSTKELLEFADIFRAEDADLISLGENIDTSSPSGRLFFSVIAATGQFEREELVSRVTASVPIRAKMGKPLGGPASFGYKWENKAFVIDETEAPVRRLIYELFLIHQRKSATADALNSQGYRTRNGALFSDTTVGRLLQDPSAKGERVANYTKSGNNKKNWQLKPEKDWIVVPCEPVVSVELWNECNAILNAQKQKVKRVGRKSVYLLAGLVLCECGASMYVFHKSPVYTCRKCKNKIAVADVDEIYHSHLEEYLTTLHDPTYLAQHDELLQEARELLANTQRERTRLAKKIDLWIDMRTQDELSKERFAEKYKPAEEQLRQLDAQLPKLEAEVDARSIQLSQSGNAANEAVKLFEQWKAMELSEKRAIVETLTKGITVGKDEISINFAYAPSVSSNDGTIPRDRRGSY